MSKRVIVLVGMVLLIILAGVVGASIARSPYTYHGSLIEPPVPAFGFELIDQDGQNFKMADQDGKVVLLLFGYTYCPDICPATLTEYRKIQSELGGKADGVQFIFITVDPERDTPQDLKTHLAYFGTSIIGLTGDLSALESVWKAFGVTVERRSTGSAAGYLIDHTARMYVVDQNGYLRITYPFGYDTTKIIRDIKHLLDE